MALRHVLGKYPNVRHALKAEVRCGSKMDLANLSISLGIPSQNVASLEGKFLKTYSN